jgi:putative DNA primase/helicase
MAVVTSNAPIFHADGGSWLTRRIVMLPFEHKPAPDKVRDLETEFEPELSAFTNHLLSISNEEIARVLRRIGKDGVSSTLWQSKIRTDSIAAWVNEWVIHAPTAKTQIGSDRHEWADKEYDPQLSTLFGSYSHYCRISGLQAKSKNNFSSDLVELCQTLGWSDVERKNDGHKRLICALKLRTNENTTPIVEDSLTTDDPPDNLPDDLSDDPKSNNTSNSDDPDGLLTSKLSSQESEKNQIIDRHVAKAAADPIALKPKKGDHVKYIGTKFQQLCNLPLIIHRVDAAYGVADCLKPDGNFTSWIPFADLKLTDSRCDSQGGSNA